MSKRAEKMKERMRRRSEASNVKKDPKKRPFNITVDIKIDGANDLTYRFKEIQRRMEEQFAGYVSERPKFIVRVDTN